MRPPVWRLLFWVPCRIFVMPFIGGQGRIASSLGQRRLHGECGKRKRAASPSRASCLHPNPIGAILHSPISVPSRTPSCGHDMGSRLSGISCPGVLFQIFPVVSEVQFAGLDAVPVLPATTAQFPQNLTLKVDFIKDMLVSGGLNKPLTALYNALLCTAVPRMEKLWEYWKGDIPSLNKEDWEDSLE